MTNRTSVLTHPLPADVLVDGIHIPICTDYRTGILFDELAKDTSLDDVSRKKLGLWLYCGDKLPPVNTDKLFSAILAFYRGEYSPMESTPRYTVRPTGSKESNVFDFVWDGNQIYAAFLQVYGIDLTEIQLHWWKFLALLTALPSDCAFMRTTALRCMDLKEIQDEELRRKFRRAKASVRIRHTQNNIKEETTWQTAP